MCREGHTSLATAGVTIATIPAMSSLFQQSLALHIHVAAGDPICDRLPQPT
ncbi:MAG: hypothetical protein ABI180_04220 [Microcoleus sp.]